MEFINIKPVINLLAAEDLPPVTVYDKNGLKSMIHFSTNQPRADVLVMVLSSISTNTKSITNFLFQAAVPKVRHYLNFTKIGEMSDCFL